MNVSPIYYAELFALGCSLFLLHPKNFTSPRLLILIMAVTVIAESAGWYYHNVLHVSNHQIYNLSVPLIILLFSFIFYNNILTSKFKRIILYQLVITILFWVANLIYIQGVQKFATYNYISGGLLLAITCTFYFIDLIKTPRHLSLFKEPLFWVATGILLMYIPKTILYSVFEYLSYHQPVNIIFAQTFQKVNIVLSFIYFSSISIACTCRLTFRS